MVVRVLSCTQVRLSVYLSRGYIFMHAYSHRCQLPLSPTAPLSTIYSYVPLTTTTSPTLMLEITLRHSGEHSHLTSRAEFEAGQRKKTRRWLSNFDASHSHPITLSPSSLPSFRPSSLQSLTMAVPNPTAQRSAPSTPHRLIRQLEAPRSRF